MLLLCGACQYKGFKIEPDGSHGYRILSRNSAEKVCTGSQSGLCDQPVSACRQNGSLLNEIEPVFEQVKYHEIPKRSHATRIGPREAVEETSPAMSCGCNRDVQKDHVAA